MDKDLPDWLVLAVEMAALSSRSLSESIRQSAGSGFSMMTRLNLSMILG
jgi:hypothetical protein